MIKMPYKNMRIVTYSLILLPSFGIGLSQETATSYFSQKQYPVSNQCIDDMQGDFGLPNQLNGTLALDVIKDLGLFSAPYPGLPLMRFTHKKGNTFEKTGLNTKSKTLVKVEYPQPSNFSDLFDAMFGEYVNVSSANDSPVICRMDLGDSIYLYRIDGTKISDENINLLQMFLSEKNGWMPQPNIEDLKRMQYLYTFSYSEIGIGGMTFMFPFQRIRLP